MQRTAPLPPAHPVRALTGLAKQIALPHEYAPERFPSFPALERTALMGFNYPGTIVVPANTTVQMMLTRQASFPFWAEQPWVSSAYLVQYITAGLASTASLSTSYIDLTLQVEDHVNNWSVVDQSATNSKVGLSGILNSLTYPVLGIDSETGPRPWTYVPANSNLLFVVGIQTAVAVTGPLNFHLTYEYWTSPGEVFSTSVNFVTSGNTLSTSYGIIPYTTTRWIRPTFIQITTGISATVPSGVVSINLIVSSAPPVFSSSVSNLGTLTFPVGTAKCLLPFSYPTEFSNSPLPWYSTRTTASAVLGTNVSQVLNKGGTVLCGRIAPQVTNPFSVSSATVRQLHPAEKSFLGLETGFYSYCPPSTDMTSFWDYTLPTGISATIPACPIYRLDNTSLVNMLYATASSVDETLAINVDWHVEFRTSSALFQIGLSAITLETLHQAQIALAAAGFFFDNPDHKPILNAVVSAAKKYAPMLASAYSPVLGTAANLILSKKPHTTVSTTSPAKSGIIPKTSKEKKAKPKSKVKVPKNKTKR